MDGNIIGLVAVTMALGIPMALMYTFYRVRKLRTDERMLRMPRRRLGPMNKVRQAKASSEPNASGSNIDAPAVEAATTETSPPWLESLDAGFGFSTTASCIAPGRPCSPSGGPQCCGTLKCKFNGGSTRVGYVCK